MAAIATHGRHVYEFGPFRVDPAERLLLREGQPVTLKARAFDILVALVQRRGRLVEKSELMRAVWADSFVEEGNLTVSISLLRRALADDIGEHKYIQTVARHGYRFVGEVRELVEPDKQLPAFPDASISLPAAPSRGNSVRRTVIIGVLALAGLAAAAIVLALRNRSGAGREINSVAVLPLRAMNSQTGIDYLKLGIADAIITRLGSTGQIKVRPTSSVRQYTESPGNPLMIGRQQRVDAVLTGNVEALPERVRVTLQLIRVRDGSLLWADTFEETPQRIFLLEDEVAERVVQSMSVSLSAGAKARLVRPATQNSQAYQLYLEGRYFWNKDTDESINQSVQRFGEAIAEDGKYALAYAGLADAYVRLGSHGMEPTEQVYPKAKAAALKALQLDDSLAEARAALGMVSFYYEWNWPEVEQEFRSAIALNPNYPLTHSRYALYLAAMGRFEEALSQAERAQELDPVSVDVNTIVGRIFYLDRRYDKSVNAYQKVIKLDPYFGLAHIRVGTTYVAEGAFANAVSEFEEAQPLSGKDPYLDGLLGYAQARSGNSDAARKLLKDLTDQSRHQPVPAFSVALVFVGLGDRDQALVWLEKAYQDRSTYLTYARVDPLLDPVRSDPRFTALLRRMALL
jgi:DNA-binding winged helix-turn-helix (wHTH) protein/TolB-like protein/Flp pilus assembly protein TadD